jgi:nucleoside-diphosphate-sugar epimerase
MSSRGLTLITGGAGYVGSAVVDELLAHGRPLRIVDSLYGRRRPSLPSGVPSDRVEFIVGDIRDPSVRRRALLGVQDVVHLAAIVGDPACARAPQLAREVNLDATRALVDDAAVAGVRRFLFASTCSNYGRMSTSMLATEESDLKPISIYAESKVAAERSIFERRSDRPVCTSLRFATVYGASRRMRFDLTINEFVRDAYLTGELVVYGKQFWRPYVHVRDVARGVHAVLTAPLAATAGEVFNVGSTEENYRKQDIVDLICKRFPQLRVTSVHKAEDPRDYRVSFEKFASALGFGTDWTVSAGIDEVGTLLSAGAFGDSYSPDYRN